MEYKSRLETLLDTLEKAPVAPDLSHSLDQAQDLIDFLRLECPTENLTPYKKRIRALKQRVAEQQFELEIKVPLDDGLTTRDGLMKHATNIMNQDVQMLKTSLQHLENAKTIGASTVTQLEIQKQQIASTHDQLYEIDDSLARSMAILRRMARKMVCNRYFGCLMTLLCVCVIIIIVIKVKP
jgi:hypothetical protein